MNDIFMSYADEDRERAGKLVGSLEACGWSVWWDRKIISGQSFDQVIERELQAAKSVVVLWSTHSIASEWVKNEAAAAAERGVLVPALIDRVKPPLEFRRKQNADLVDWDGDTSHPGFQALYAGVADRAGTIADAIPADASAPAQAGSGRRRWMLWAIAVIAFALGFAVYWGPTGASDQPAYAVQGVAIELADLVAGAYHGAIISDSKGSSKSDVTVTVVKVSNRKVRITSDYQRLGSVEVELTRVGNTLTSAGGSPTLLVELESKPPRLSYNPDAGVAYTGQKQ